MSIFMDNERRARRHTLSSPSRGPGLGPIDVRTTLDSESGPQRRRELVSGAPTVSARYTLASSLGSARTSSMTK